jgi:hypothetical protein
MMDSGRRHLVCLSGAIELEDTKRAFYVMNGREMRNVPSCRNAVLLFASLSLPPPIRSDSMQTFFPWKRYLNIYS